ncbi:MAG: hypothetical protein GWM87_06295 [Xanthomonadales bacterium]|nr:hypothetical protein [Xanthomonadales bacterium]NIX12580.1 hypothetical protein [Xanthomonadales bacterium]
MSAWNLLGLLLAAVVAVQPVPAPAQQADTPPMGVLELREKAGQAYFKEDYAAFRDAMVTLHQLRPNNSEYMYRLVLAHALMNDLRPAFDMMLRMQQQGLHYDFDQTEDSRSLRDTEVYGYLNNLMKIAGEPVGTVEEVALLDADVRFPEGLAWDPTREAYLVGTVTDGLVLSVSESGERRELLRAGSENGMWSVFDLLVDAARNRLWVSSSAHPNFSGFDPVDAGRSALFEFTLDDLELVRRYPVPVDGLRHNLGNLAQAPNGDIYAADSRVPLVYLKPAGADRMRPLFTSPRLVSLRGLALSDDGESLYVADYEVGIVRFDIPSQQLGPVGRPGTLNLGGIDGLYYWNGHLVIIQNGISPQRIMRLKLDDAGTAIESVSPMAASLDVFDMPNYGTVRGDELVFFANSHWNDAPDQLSPVRIVRANIAEARELVSPEMQDFLRKQEEKQRLQPPFRLPSAEEDPGSGG